MKKRVLYYRIGFIGETVRGYGLSVVFSSVCKQVAERYASLLAESFPDRDVFLQPFSRK